MTGNGTNWKQLREAYKTFGVQFDPTEMVSLAVNQTRDLGHVRKLLKNYAGRMDSWGIGTTWSETHVCGRANGIFFVEHVRSNIHVHGLVHFPYANWWGRRMMTQHFWRRLCPSGTINLQRPYDVLGAADYMTKEMKWRDFDDRQVILLSDLMSEKSLFPRPTKQR